MTMMPTDQNPMGGGLFGFNAPPGGLNNLGSNPLFMAGLGLLSAGRDRRIDPFQAAGQGLLTANQMQNAQADADMRRQQFGFQKQKFDYEQQRQQKSDDISSQIPGLLAQNKTKEAAALALSSGDSGMRDWGRGLLTPKAPEIGGLFGKFTPQSIAAYQNTDDPTVLIPIPETLTPYQKASLDLDRQRLNMLPPPPAGYRWTEGGGMEAIKGGQADAKMGQKNSVPTEDERKAAGWLAQAQNGFNNMTEAIKDDSDASSPGYWESASFLPEGFRNWTRSEARQKFTQGASSFAEAALRQATGAGGTKDEAEQKIRELTPQWGDTPGVIQQKRDSLNVYLDSLKTRAGRAAPPDTNGWGIKEK